MSSIDIPAPRGFDISEINLRVMGACEAFASRDENRIYLNGVMVEIGHGHVNYIATDGQQLIAYHDNSAQGTNMLVGNFVIPRIHCKPFKLAKEASGIAKIYEEDGGRLTIAYGDVDIRFAPIDGPFPNWQSLIPKEVSGNPGQFFLKELVKFEKFSEELELGLPDLRHNGKDGPAVVEWARKTVSGLVIPRRGLDEAVIWRPPGWAAPLPNESGQVDIEEVIERAANVSDFDPHAKRAS